MKNSLGIITIGSCSLMLIYIHHSFHIPDIIQSLQINNIIKMLLTVEFFALLSIGSGLVIQHLEHLLKIFKKVFDNTGTYTIGDTHVFSAQEYIVGAGVLLFSLSVYVFFLFYG